MTTDRSFAAFLDRVRPSVDRTLDRLLPAADARPAVLHEAMRYSLFAGGKRVRPALVLLTARRLGARPLRRVLPGAARRSR